LYAIDRVVFCWQAILLGAWISLLQAADHSDSGRAQIGTNMIGPWRGDDASHLTQKTPRVADTPEVRDRRRVRRNRHQSSERSNRVQDDRPSRNSGAQDR
jgi:hypothetical protein